MGNDPIQGGGRGTYVALETSSTMGRWDRPPRREAQGDGAAVVLGGRESRPRGKGGRCPETRTGRSARCALPKPYWESSTTAASRCPSPAVVEDTGEPGAPKWRMPGSGRGGRKSAGNGNSLAAYSTLLCNLVNNGR